MLGAVLSLTTLHNAEYPAHS